MWADDTVSIMVRGWLLMEAGKRRQGGMVRSKISLLQCKTTTEKFQDYIV